MIKNFFNRILQFYYSTNKKEVLLQSKLRQEIDSIKKREFKKDNKNLIPFGFKVFSQTDEDGIINAFGSFQDQNKSAKRGHTQKL